MRKIATKMDDFINVIKRDPKVQDNNKRYDR